MLYSTSVSSSLLITSGLSLVRSQSSILPPRPSHEYQPVNETLRMSDTHNLHLPALYPGPKGFLSSSGVKDTISSNPRIFLSILAQEIISS